MIKIMMIILKEKWCYMPVNLNESLRDQISLITDKYNLFLRNTEKNLYQNNLMIDSDYNVISSTNG